MGKRARVFLAVMMISMAFGTYSVEATSKDVGGTVHIQSESGTDDEEGDVTFLGKSYDDTDSEETSDKVPRNPPLTKKRALTRKRVLTQKRKITLKSMRVRTALIQQKTSSPLI